MISVKGKWTLPESYAREKRIDDANDASNLWNKRFARLKTTYIKSLRTGKNSEEAYAALQAINDPMAANAIADALDESDGPKLRRLYVQKLGQFKNSTAVRALVQIGLYDADDNLRLLAIDQLKDYGASSAVLTCLPVLKDDKQKPAAVTAALRLLNHFPDPELWQNYIDALVTEHKTIIPPGPAMQFGQNNRGGAGAQMGGKAKVKIDKVRNAGAVELLKTIAPGVDYRYDEAAWRSHFASQLMGSTSDLRRDP